MLRGRASQHVSSEALSFYSLCEENEVMFLNCHPAYLHMALVQEALVVEYARSVSLASQRRTCQLCDN